MAVEKPQRQEFDGRATHHYRHDHDLEAVDTSYRSVQHRQTRASHRRRLHEEPVNVGDAVGVQIRHSSTYLVHRSKELVVESVGKKCR